MTSMTLSDGGPVCFLDERYELGEVIGEGAVGRVYAAFDIVLGIDVAVKVMHDTHVHSRRMVERFSNEAHIAARMMSPYIVKVLGLAVTRTGAPCIVYERLEGETLSSFIDREGRLSLEATNEIVKQTARALARVHALGVVHRDVKPDNIFITTDPNGHALVKLLDFGVAEAMTSDTTSHEVVGTPEYMAPEVVFGNEVLDARVDVYALGVVAFECLTGSCPFTGERTSDVFSAVQNGTRGSVCDANPDLAAEVDDWADCALHSDPYWRFASAKELARALDTVATAVTQRAAHVAVPRVAA